MPVSNFTAKLLEMEDTIIEDLHTTNSEVHIFFSLKRKPHTCPHCHTVTEKVHGYRLSILKDLPIMSKKLFYIIVKDTIIVRAVINIFTNPSDYSQSTAASLHVLLSIPSTFSETGRVSEPSPNSLESQIPLSFEGCRMSAFQSHHTFQKCFLLMNLEGMPEAKNFRQSSRMPISTNFSISSLHGHRFH